MEVSYRREIKHNYLVVIPDGGSESGYEAKMLAGNEIRGLMHMHIRYQDGSPFYYYDITSRQPLSRLLETRFITRDEICQILIQLHVALMRMEEYLLSDGGILLNPDLIYVEPELFHISLCVVPGHRGDFPEQLSRFLQYILKCVNHKDRECVVLAYGMYQESLKDNYGIEDILKFISLNGEKEGRDGIEERMGKQGNISREQGVWGAQSGWGEKAKQGAWAVDDWKSDWNEAEGQDRTEGGKGNSQQVERNKAYEGSVGKVIPIGKQAAAWLIVVILLPVALWLLKGMNAVRDLGFAFICLDGGLLLAFAATDLVLWMVGGRKKEGEVGQNRGIPHTALYERVHDISREQIQGTLRERLQDSVRQKPQASGGDNDPWRILYEDEEEPDFLSGQYNGLRKADEDNEACKGNVAPESAAAPIKDHNEEVFQTTLLTGRQQDEGILRRLISIGGAEKDIIISYYPFVIGKNRNLADYALQKDTVSRFHLRIDVDGGTYTVTDLNSTNGTRVRGRILDANETAVIETGDEIMIADIGYIFS